MGSSGYFKASSSQLTVLLPPVAPLSLHLPVPICCVLIPWALCLGSVTQAGSLCCLFDARGLLPTGILSAGQSFPTRSLHFSEALLVLMERCSRISLMVNKVFLDFPLIFTVCLLGSAVPLRERSSSHLPACKISLLYLTALLCLAEQIQSFLAEMFS